MDKKAERQARRAEKDTRIKQDRIATWFKVSLWSFITWILAIISFFTAAFIQDIDGLEELSMPFGLVGVILFPITIPVTYISGIAVVRHRPIVLSWLVAIPLIWAGLGWIAGSQQEDQKPPNKTVE